MRLLRSLAWLPRSLRAVEAFERCFVLFYVLEHVPIFPAISNVSISWLGRRCTLRKIDLAKQWTGYPAILQVPKFLIVVKGLD